MRNAAEIDPENAGVNIADVNTLSMAGLHLRSSIGWLHCRTLLDYPYDGTAGGDLGL